MSNQDNRETFLYDLRTMISRAEAAGSFRGKTVALRALKRILLKMERG